MKLKVNILTLSAMFLALAYILPFFTGQIPQIGNMLCPMHIPIMLCGFFCGGNWGFLVGFLSPLLRSVTLGVPIMFPSALCMAFELAVYGMTAGSLYRRFPKKKVYIYISLIMAMILGRLVWGIMMFLCMGINGGAFGISAFIAGALTNAVPGIVLQLIVVPIVVMGMTGRNQNCKKIITEEYLGKF